MKFEKKGWPFNKDKEEQRKLIREIKRLSASGHSDIEIGKIMKRSNKDIWWARKVLGIQSGAVLERLAKLEKWVSLLSDQLRDMGYVFTEEQEFRKKYFPKLKKFIPRGDQ